MEQVHVERSGNQNLPVLSTSAVASPNPFSVERVFYEWKTGESLADILLNVQPNVACWNDINIFIAGHKVDRKYWHVVYAKPGQEIVITSIPKKSVIKTILIIAVVALASAYAPHLASVFSGGFGGSPLQLALAKAAIATVGMLAVNALIPIEQPELGGFNDNVTARTLSIGGSRNPIAPFAPIPTTLGKHIIYPPYAAAPYTELVGDDQYVIMLFVLGYRDMEIDPATLRLGDVPLSSYTDVEYELYSGGSNDISLDKASGLPITLYPDIANENLVSAQITDTSWVQSNTALNIDHIIYEIHFLSGLTTTSGGPLTVNVDVEYSDDGIIWTYLRTHSFTASSTQAIRKGYQWTPPFAGQWYIRMQADQPGDNTTTNIWERFFAVLRSFQMVNPVSHPDVALLALRIKATDQLNGIPDNVNLIQQTIAPDWTGSAWVDAPTSNPASLARFILMGKANARPLAANRLDDTAFQDFHDWCVLNNFEYTKPIEGEVTLWVVLQQVCAAGRGKPLQVDGLWTIKIDKAQPTSLQMFSARNSSNFSGEKVFPDPIHAYRVRFIDAQNNYKNEEQVIYAPGYDENNSSHFEALEFPGVTDWDQIYKLTQYYIAITRLQPESFSFNTDIENLVSLPMDRIEYQNDSILVGLGAGRVVNIDLNGVDIDDQVPMAGFPDGTYAVKFRLSSGATKVIQVKTTVGLSSRLEFVTPELTLPAAMGDLVIFGEYGLESMDLIIKSILPGPNLSAQLVCLPYNDAIYTADGGSIPAYNPTITYPPGVRNVSIASLRSDETVLWRDASGNWQVQILGTFAFPSARAIDVTGIIVQWRHRVGGINSATWISLPTLSRDARSFSIIGVSEGDEIEIRTAVQLSGNVLGLFTNYVDPVTMLNYHTVIGKTSPPPDLDSLSVTVNADGTRVYSWAFHPSTFIPQDLDGFEIRYWDYDLVANLTPAWDSMTPLKTLGKITESPYEANAPFSGDWVFGIRAKDYGGRLSVNVTYSGVITLPLPRLGGTIAYRSAWENAWNASAVLTSCYVDPSTGYLAPDDSTTWTTMVDFSGGPWAQAPASPITFEDVVWDLGTGTTDTVWSVTPDFDATGSASVLIEIRQHPTAIASASYATFNPATTYTDRYQQFRITGTNIEVEGLRDIIFQGYAP